MQEWLKKVKKKESETYQKFETNLYELGRRAKQQEQ
jgi:hypothetical protein